MLCDAMRHTNLVICVFFSFVTNKQTENRLSYIARGQTVLILLVWIYIQRRQCDGDGDG